MDRAGYAGMIGTQNGRTEGCLISRQDWEILVRGQESERERSYRNLFLGIASSSAFGTLATVASHSGQLFSAAMTPLASTCLMLMISATLAAGALTAFFHRRISRFGPGRALQLLNETIRIRLEHPEDPYDPRQWP